MAIRQINYGNDCSTISSEFGELKEGYKSKVFFLTCVFEFYELGIRVYVKPIWRFDAYIYQFRFPQ